MVGITGMYLMETISTNNYKLCSEIKADIYISLNIQTIDKKMLTPKWPKPLAFMVSKYTYLDCTYTAKIND